MQASCTQALRIAGTSARRCLRWRTFSLGPDMAISVDTSGQAADRMYRRQLVRVARDGYLSRSLFAAC